MKIILDSEEKDGLIMTIRMEQKEFVEIQTMVYNWLGSKKESTKKGDSQ